MAYLPRSNTWGRLVSFWLVNAQSVGFTVSLTTISSNMAGYTHRSLASALVFTAYCWGNFAGMSCPLPHQLESLCLPLMLSMSFFLHIPINACPADSIVPLLPGPFVVNPADAPRYEGATIGLLAGYSIKLGCHLGLLGE